MTQTGSSHAGAGIESEEYNEAKFRAAVEKLERERLDAMYAENEANAKAEAEEAKG